jgi:hypothetical protein
MVRGFVVQLLLFLLFIYCPFCSRKKKKNPSKNSPFYYRRSESSPAIFTKRIGQWREMLSSTARTHWRGGRKDHVTLTVTISPAVKR